ncbi:MAG: BON domain-containing protein [Actinomycetota bacterium]|nr:BON domain-containing protein [Actinomycetota bacterium]
MEGFNPDETMRDAVVRELEWDARLDAQHIGVTATDGAVTLSGHVASYSDRRWAVKAAERVYGVRAVADEIEVKLPAASVRDDSDIAEAITRLLKWSTAIPASVKAEVLKGHVTLRGEVQWQYQRDEVERSIRYLAGVQSVSNAIAIKSHQVDAADVVQQVGDAIKRMAAIDARSVWVTTSGGTVRLHGHVHSFAERRTAGLAAASAPGVSHVENEVLVTP